MDRLADTGKRKVGSDAIVSRDHKGKADADGIRSPDNGQDGGEEAKRQRLATAVQGSSHLTAQNGASPTFAGADPAVALVNSSDRLTPLTFQHSAESNTYMDAGPRVLDMQASPVIGGSPSIQTQQPHFTFASSNQGWDRSSPIKRISHHDLPEAFREDVQGYSESPYPARVGTWLVPNRPELLTEAHADIDPNGDDEVVSTQVRQLLRPSLTTDPSPPLVETSSHPRNMLPTSGHKPESSTPPAPRRARRPVARGRQVSPSSPALETPRGDHPSSIGVDSERISDVLGSLYEIIADPYSETASAGLTRLSDASPLIPGFLKPEFRRYIQRYAAIQRESQGTSESDSETQEDGFLRTKAQWALELCKIMPDDEIKGGDDIIGDVSADEETVVVLLSTSPSACSYTVRKAPKDQILLWRSDVRTNPWFDASGQPFAVTYQSPQLLTYTSSSNGSLVTQHDTQEMPAMRRDLHDALEAKIRLHEELDLALSASRSTQEQADLVRTLYNEASRSASKSERELEKVSAENERLRYQVVEGLRLAQGFAYEQIAQIRASLSQVTRQRDLLLQQNELTNDEIRRKAVAWDVHEARKLQEQKRREQAEAARLETHLALQATILGQSHAKKPQDYLLEVDLDAQRRDLPIMSDNTNIVLQPDGEGDDEDELAALQREAAQHGNETMLVDPEAPRSRRTRAARSTSRQAPSAPSGEDNEVAALREEAAAAGDSSLSAPRPRRSRSRQPASSLREVETPDSTLDTSSQQAHTSRPLPSSRRTRVRYEPNEEEVEDMAAAIAHGQSEALEATRHDLAEQLASFQAAAAPGNATENQ